VKPYVVVDIGNSRMKWGRVSGARITEAVAFAHDDAVGWKRQCALWRVAAWDYWVIVSVVPKVQQRFTEWLDSRESHWVSITNEQLLYGINENNDFTDPAYTAISTYVDVPDLVGTDRLLNALAASKRTPPGVSAVAISVGTAMTIDFVEGGGLHRGGAILPGPRLMAKSLHNFTAKLPLVETRPQLPTMNWGANTEDAIELGIANAILGAADQMVWDWAANHASPPWVYVTGGDAEYFRGFEFTADVGGVVIDPTLTLDGIRLAVEALP